MKTGENPPLRKKPSNMIEPKTKDDRKLVLFFGQENGLTNIHMSQEARRKASGERDIHRTSNTIGQQKNYEGFEGMNYEQIRQPYNPKHTLRIRLTDEPTEPKRQAEE